jgi:hypothetical protein
MAVMMALMSPGWPAMLVHAAVFFRVSVHAESIVPAPSVR